MRLHALSDELGERVEDRQRGLMQWHIVALRCLQHERQELWPARRLIRHDVDAKLTNHVRDLFSDRSVGLGFNADK